MDIEGCVAVVTGSSSGVGAACARQLAQKGCHVVINYSRNEAGAQETSDACRELGVETLVIGADVADDAACRRIAAAADEKWGRIDALVNNAGTTKFCDHKDLEGLSHEDWMRLYAVNTVGAFQMVRAVQPIIERGERGSIVNVASMAGVTGLGSSIAYAASKGALITMTLSLARVLGPKIRVNAICPGLIEGDWLLKGLGPETYERWKEGAKRASALKRNSTPEIIAEGILYFVTGSEVITGETLMMDGGMHLSTAPLGKR